MATATLNGKLPRKQLSDQLDRMDTLMDGLADALPEAVADACRDGARQAVKDTVLELLASPELRNLITEVTTAQAATSSEAVASKPSIWSRVRAKLAATRACIAEPIQKVKDAITNRVATVAATLSFAARCLMAVMPIGKVLLIGAGIGLVVSVVSYACPHSVSSVIAGVAASCTAVTAQVGGLFRRSMQLLA